MLKFSALIQKYNKQGEKTGWTYILIAEELALQLKPGNKKAFRVKGKLDAFKYEGISLIPIGGGDFIMPLNATIRKHIKKTLGAELKVQMEIDHKPPALLPEFLECLADEPEALRHFNTMPPSHQNYFSKWIESAKTEETKTKRIAQAVNALARHLNYAEMIRSARKDKDVLMGL